MKSLQDLIEAVTNGLGLKWEEVQKVVYAEVA